MTDHSTQYSTVTVPVGFGGKSNPYVPDPAPTLLVELASVDRAKEEQKVAALLREAESTAAAVSAEAESAAATLRAEAEETASSLIASARAEAAALIAAAEEEAHAIRRTADESVADTLSNIEIRQTELDERAAALESLQSELEEREGHLTQRLAAVDAEVAEAAAVLSSAHTEADSVRAEARTAAEEILESARQQAEDEARALIAEARTAAHDSAVGDRIADIESVHRIEVQVLHDREVELLERIAALEARATTPPLTDESEGTDDEASNASPAEPEKTPTDSPAKQNGRAPRDHDESVAIDLDGEHADVTVRKDSRLNGRHGSDGGHATDRSPSPGPIVTHAPLTEQLSTSAFRAVPENDRRGRRRR